MKSGVGVTRQFGPSRNTMKPLEGTICGPCGRGKRRWKKTPHRRRNDVV